MSRDLIALVVGITLGITVVGLGLWRNLADVTRSWLPRFGGPPKPVTAVPESFDGGQARRQPSPRQRKLAIGLYLFMSLYNAAITVFRADDRPMHAGIAALFAIGAVVLIVKERHLS